MTEVVHSERYIEGCSEEAIESIHAELIIRGAKNQRLFIAISIPLLAISEVKRVI